MENTLRDPSPGNKKNWVLWAVVVIVLLVLCPVLYFAGRFLYSLGQRTAAQVSGVDLTPHPTATATIYVSPTVTPTVTLTPTKTPYVVFPTATATKIPWTSCPGIVVSMENTSKGYIVHVLRCSDGLKYDIGPIAKGAYAVSPDDKYLVFCSNDGILYGARIGTAILHTILDVRRNGEFTVFYKKVEPNFRLTFVEAPSGYILKVYEMNYNQNMPIIMPRWLDQ